MNSTATERISKVSHVLLVEDDAGTAELMRRSLLRTGYSVDVATGVESGLEALRGNGHGKFDVLLLDYHLPDGEPWQVADAAQACVPRVFRLFL